MIYSRRGYRMNFFDRSDFAHRTYCEVCEEMRKILRYSDVNSYEQSVGIMKCLVEELQIYGNRMEAALAYKGDLVKLHEERKKLQAEVDELKKQLPEKKEEGDE